MKRSNLETIDSNKPGPSKSKCLENLNHNFIGDRISIDGSNIIAKKGHIYIGNIINITNSIAQQFLYGVSDPVAHFTGREQELMDLHNEFQKSSVAVLTQAINICGLGGIGKTQLAKAYIKRNGHLYNTILFFAAENLSTLEESICHVAGECKIDIMKPGTNETKPIQYIIDSLYTKIYNSGDGLIVFDNVEEPENMINFLCKQSLLRARIKTLITSRTLNWQFDDFEEFKIVKLDVWTKSEANEFVKSYLKTELYIENEVNQLCESLQCFPLAMRQAVAFINDRNHLLIVGSKKFKIVDYLKLYKNGEKSTILDYHKVTDMYTRTVLNTWRITINKLNQTQEGRNAVKIFEYIAYLIPEDIPYKIVFKTDENLNNAAAIAILIQNCLIDINRECINVHRLVQQVTRLEIGDREENIINELINLINDCKIKEKTNLYQSAAVVWQIAVKYTKILDELYFKSPISPLILCVHEKKCDVQTVKKFLEYELRNENYETIQDSFLISIEHSNVDVMKFLYYLFEKYSALDINCKNEKGNTAVMLASRAGHIDILNLLHENKKSDIYHKNNRESSALLLACEFGHYNVTTFLLQHYKWDIKQVDEDGDNALTCAAHSGNIDIVKTILEIEECDVFHKNIYGQTALLVACEKGNYEVVNHLLQHCQWDIKQVDEDGDNALTLAARSGNIDIVDTILKIEGCEVFHKNESGRTALLMACIKGNYKMVKYLLQHYKWDMKQIDNDGENALNLAAWSGNFDTFETILKIEQCDVFHRNKNGRTVLLLACMKGRYKVVKYLLQHYKWDIKQVDEDGDNALTLAAWSGNIDTVATILKIEECDVFHKNKSGKTALLLACNNGKHQVVEHLLQRYKWDIKQVDNYGNNALTLAALSGNIDTVKTILEIEECDVFHKNKNGYTALDCAENRDYDDIVEFLKREM